MAQNEDGSPQSIFQIVILTVFAVLAVAGIAIVALFKSESTGTASLPNLVMWGEGINEAEFLAVIDKIRSTNDRMGKFEYVGMPQGTLYSRILEAIAVGRAPDLVIVDNTTLLPLKNKLQPISYEMLSIGAYRETYVEGAEMFALSEGVYALPFAVDPLVLYWNRDLFTNAALAQVPKEWDTIVKSVDTLTIRTANGDITQSMLPFGEYDNVLHAKEIVSALLLQSGVYPVRERDKSFVPTLREGDSGLALTFYTDFSNPTKRVYSWNKTFDRSREAFARNKTALYVGPASEVFVLPTINPNLNFDITLLPQSASRQNKVTYGKFYGIAIMNSSKYKGPAYEMASILASQQSASLLRSIFPIPSTRRDSLATDPQDPYRDTLVRSAIIARGWLEPNGSETDTVFRKMINDVVSGRSDSHKALGVANDDLEVLLASYGR